MPNSANLLQISSKLQGHMLGCVSCGSLITIKNKLINKPISQAPVHL